MDQQEEKSIGPTGMVPVDSTAAFEVLQRLGPRHINPATARGFHQVLEQLKTLKPERIEGLVLMARVRCDDREEEFDMAVCMLGDAALVAGLSAMAVEMAESSSDDSKEFLRAVTALALSRKIKAAGGCGDPSCQTCNPKTH